jgi:hypothetical protein
MEHKRRRHRRGVAPPSYLANTKRLGALAGLCGALLATISLVVAAIAPAAVSSTSLAVAEISGFGTVAGFFTAIVAFGTGLLHAETVEREIYRAELDNDTARRNERLRDGGGLVGIESDAPPRGGPVLVGPTEELHVVIEIHIHLPD